MRPESLNSACRPEFAGTCNISINREFWCWMVNSLGLVWTRLNSKTFLMKDLDDGFWSVIITLFQIPTQRDHITTRGCRPTLGQIKDQEICLWYAQVGGLYPLLSFPPSHHPWLLPPSPVQDNLTTSAFKVPFSKSVIWREALPDNCYWVSIKRQTKCKHIKTNVSRNCFWALMSRAL